MLLQSLIQSTLKVFIIIMTHIYNKNTIPKHNNKIITVHIALGNTELNSTSF